MIEHRRWYHFLNAHVRNIKMNDMEITWIISIHESKHTDVNGNNLSYCQKMADVYDDPKFNNLKG